MPFVDDILSFLSRNRGYFLGKALLAATVAGASSLFGVSILVPAMLIVGGGLALRTYRRFTEISHYKQQMVDLYREDIAAQLGIAPEMVGVENLKEAAKGNDVIAQALARQRTKNFIELGTSLLAATVTFGLLFSFGDTGQFHDFIRNDLGLSNFLGSAVNFIGLSTVGGISGLIFHDALGLAIGAKTGTIKAAAHDLILEMENNLRHGRPISREQVYGVLVAANPQLQEAITTRFQKSYSWMNAAEQSRVLHILGIADTLDNLAQQVNRGEIRPGRLAYLMDDHALSSTRRVELSRGELTHASTDISPAADISTSEPRSFVERVGPRPQGQSSFVERVSSARENLVERSA